MSVGHSFSALLRAPPPFKILVVLYSSQARSVLFLFHLFISTGRQRQKMEDATKEKKHKSPGASPSPRLGQDPWDTVTHPSGAVLSGPPHGEGSGPTPQGWALAGVRAQWARDAWLDGAGPGRRLRSLWTVGVGAPGEGMTTMLHRCPRLFL